MMDELHRARVADLAARLGKAGVLDVLPPQWFDDPTPFRVFDSLGGRFARCKAPKCGARLWFFKLPSGRHCPYDETALPHDSHCAAGAGAFRKA